MPVDPYAVLRALLRAEAARNGGEPKPEPRPRLNQDERPARKRDR
ncbi:hypothetical protein [Streptomyces sp. NPDC003832]